MTAPETARPADEHTDAVARAVDPDIFDPTVKRSTHPAAVIQIAARKHMASEAARNVLTSTDPAVHAAMLDALVRAGAWERAMDGHEPAAGMCLDVECFCGWPTREDFERGGDNWTPDYREHLLDILAHEVAP